MLARVTHCGKPSTSPSRHAATRGSGSPRRQLRTPAINPAVSIFCAYPSAKKLNRRGGSGGGSGVGLGVMWVPWRSWRESGEVWT